MNRNLPLVALKILVSASLLYLVLSPVDWKDVTEMLLRARLPEAALAALCMILAVALNAVRWREVLALLGHPVPRRVTLTGTFEGMFFNLFLPSSVGGDALRAYRAFDHGVGVSVALTSVLVDRALGLLAVGMFLLAALPLAAAMRALSFFDALVVLSGVIVAGGVAGAFVGRLLDPARMPAWLRPLAVLVRSYGRVLVSARFLLTIVPILVAANLLIGSAMWLVARAVGADIAFFDAMIVLQASTLAALIPISFGGWGVREGTAVFLLSAIGFGGAEAVAVSVAFGFVLMFAGLIGAVVWMSTPYRGGLRLSQLRERLGAGASSMRGQVTGSGDG